MATTKNILAKNPHTVSFPLQLQRRNFYFNYWQAVLSPPLLFNPWNNQSEETEVCWIRRYQVTKLTSHLEEREREREREGERAQCGRDKVWCNPNVPIAWKSLCSITTSVCLSLPIITDKAMKTRKDFWGCMSLPVTPTTDWEWSVLVHEVFPDS